ncbi:MAG: hypothetical protein JOS17DRAFT_814467 [Linnemannia elongata]|nr:MAG: hypothetical protein JOS17DRAFT_814467 [Linnemannia elongata]
MYRTLRVFSEVGLFTLSDACSFPLPHLPPSSNTFIVCLPVIFPEDVVSQSSLLIPCNPLFMNSDIIKLQKKTAPTVPAGAHEGTYEDTQRPLLGAPRYRSTPGIKGRICNAQQ